MLCLNILLDDSYALWMIWALLCKYTCKVMNLMLKKGNKVNYASFCVSGGWPCADLIAATWFMINDVSNTILTNNFFDFLAFFEQSNFEIFLTFFLFFFDYNNIMITWRKMMNEISSDMQINRLTQYVMNGNYAKQNAR